MPDLSAGPAPTLQEPENHVGFDRVAWCYDALAGLVFGRALKKAQSAALAGLPAGTPHVLILGGGTGWVLVEVLRRRPQATILYLEASPKMLNLARARLHREYPEAVPQVEFRHGTQAALSPAEDFDVIVTFFVLDCLASADVASALARLRAALRPGSSWRLADFRRVERGWQRALLALMYTFFRLTTGLRARELPDLHPALTRLGLRAAGFGTFFGGAVEAVVFTEMPVFFNP